MVAKSKRGKSPESDNKVYSKGDYLLVYEDDQQDLFIVVRVPSFNPAC
jgi:hypothetical protein